MIGNEASFSQQAAHWHMAIEDDPTNAELAAELSQWLDASPQHRDAWAKMLQTFDALGNLEMTTALAVTGSSNSSTDAPKPSRRKRIAFIATVTLSGAIAACFAFLFTPALLLKWRSDHYAPAGETQSITLSDQSTLGLSSSSAVSAAYVENARSIELLQGEAFVDVTSDSNRPFRVIAGDTEVTVIGTAFNVQRGANFTTVSVEHGRVRVSNKYLENGTLELGAGDWLRIDAEGKSETGNQAPEQVGFWRDGKILADNRLLSEIVEEIDRYYPGSIFIQDETLGAERGSGLYKTEDPVKALRALMESNGGELQQISPWVIVLSRDD